MRNVILLTIDALRKDALGCYGNRNGLTPFMDSLQDKCIRFMKAQSVGPYTQASFPGILTSSYYLEYGREEDLSPKRTLISQVLKKSGIVTAAFHSNPYLSDDFGWNRGWDTFYDSMDDDVSSEVPYIKGDRINTKARLWLSSYTKEEKYKPFFIWLHYMDVHEPYIPGRKYIDMVDASINLNQDEMFNLFEKVLLKRDVSNEEMVALLKKLYDARVREVDDYIKEFFCTLEKLNLLKKSVIILTADHGDEFNEHGGLSHDGKMYSELMDIPLFIYDYDRVKPELYYTLVSNLDIPPTILNLFNLEPIEDFEGHSLLPFENYRKKGCFGEAIDKIGSEEKDTDKPIYLYRENDIKIIYRESNDIWEMYNLKDDPTELNNMIDTSSIAEDMKKKLKPRIGRWIKG